MSLLAINNNTVTRSIVSGNTACLSLLHTPSNKTYVVTVKGMGNLESFLTRIFYTCLYFLTCGQFCKGKFYDIKDGKSQAHCWVYSFDVDAATQALEHDEAVLDDTPEEDLFTSQIPPTSADQEEDSTGIKNTQPSISDPSFKKTVRKTYTVPANVADITAAIVPLKSLLTQITPYLYIDKQHARIFCFNRPEDAPKPTIARFLFDVIPSGTIFFCVQATSARVAELAAKPVYRALAELIEENSDTVTDKSSLIDLLLFHPALNWNLIFNPASDDHPWFKPGRIAQILYMKNPTIPRLYSEPAGIMDDAVTKFTQTWVGEEHAAANEKRRTAVEQAIKKIERCLTGKETLPADLGKPVIDQLPAPINPDNDPAERLRKRIDQATETVKSNKTFSRQSLITLLTDLRRVL